MKQFQLIKFESFFYMDVAFEHILKQEILKHFQVPDGNLHHFQVFNTHPLPSVDPQVYPPSEYKI